jgi:YidC/Oxa1 family membrane protein insertase
VAALFKTIFFTPLYNGFVFLIGTLPFLDAGIIIVLFTVIVKLALFPLSKSSIRTQLLMKRLEPETNRIKEKYKNDKEGQARAMMAFYKENKINPLSGIVLVLIQFPILIALYWVFLRSNLPTIDCGLIYSSLKSTFCQLPMKMDFLGLINIHSKSYVLAVLAGIAQFAQTKLSMPPSSPDAKGIGADITRAMQTQMKFVMPLIIVFIAYKYTAVVALYLITSAIFAIGQELYLRRTLIKK